MRTNSKIVTLAFFIFFSVWQSSALARVNIFACEPEWAALSKELAPDAKIYTATTAMQDPHQVQARPSLIAKMRQADLVVCAGAGLEVGWLPMLQMKSANPKVQSTDKGLFYAAQHTETLDKMTKVDRSMGDVHAGGNPHIHLDINRLLSVANALSKKLEVIDPDNVSHYRSNLSNFENRWRQASVRWKTKAIPLAGSKVIAYHSNYRYLFNWIGIEQVADLEPKPGIPPSSGHLVKLLKRTSQGDIKAVIYASYQNSHGAMWLSNKSGIPVIELPMSVGGSEQAQDLISLYDDILDRLLTGINPNDS